MTTGFRAQPDGFPIIDKSPDAVLPYSEDWASTTAGFWLSPGETIASAVWTVATGLTQMGVSLTPNGAATVATIILSGGVVGTTYLVSCKITTSLGNIDTRSFRISVKLR